MTQSTPRTAARTPSARSGTGRWRCRSGRHNTRLRRCSRCPHRRTNRPSSDRASRCFPSSSRHVTCRCRWWACTSYSRCTRHWCRAVGSRIRCAWCSAHPRGRAWTGRSEARRRSCRGSNSCHCSIVCTKYKSVPRRCRRCSRREPRPRCPPTRRRRRRSSPSPFPCGSCRCTSRSCWPPCTCRTRCWLHRGRLLRRPSRSRHPQRRHRVDPCCRRRRDTRALHNNHSTRCRRPGRHHTRPGSASPERQASRDRRGSQCSSRRS